MSLKAFNLMGHLLTDTFLVRVSAAVSPNLGAMLAAVQRVSIPVPVVKVVEVRSWIRPRPPCRVVEVGVVEVPQRGTRG